MARGRREKIDERVARMVREQRAARIEGSQGAGLLHAYLEHEDWFSGDPPEDRPIPEMDHQPAMEEPDINTLTPDVWSELDPYWLRVPEDGIYRVSLVASTSISLNLGGPGGYHGLQLDTYVESWRSLPPGDDPQGRDDPFGIGAWGGISGFTYDQKFLPEGHDSFNLAWSISGIPVELSEDDSLRVIFRPNTVDPFDTGDEWFATSFQGEIAVELLSGS